MACYPWAHRTKIVFRTVSATELPGNLKSLPQRPLSLSFPLWPVDSKKADDCSYATSCYVESWVNVLNQHAVRTDRAERLWLHPTLGLRRGPAWYVAYRRQYVHAHMGSVIPQLSRIMLSGHRVSYLGFSVAVRLQSHDTPGFAVMRRTLRRLFLRRM
jgi:hypothetical protein